MKTIALNQKQLEHFQKTGEIVFPIDEEELQNCIEYFFVAECEEDVDREIIEFGLGNSGIGLYVGDSEYPEHGSHYIQPPYKIGEQVGIKEDFRVVGVYPDDGELEIVFESNKKHEIVSFTEDEDFEGDRFDEFWATWTDDCENAGVPMDEGKFYDLTSFKNDIFTIYNPESMPEEFIRFKPTITSIDARGVDRKWFFVFKTE